MGKKIAITVLAIGLLVALVSILGGSTGAHLSDTERSSGNVFGGWEPSQSDCLIVDTTYICIGPCGKCLCGVKIQKDCECQYDVILDKVRLSWEPDNGENVVLMQIWVHDWIEWWGSAPSGAELDISDFTLDPCDRRYCICFCFDGDMHEKGFTIEFIMGDGSIASASFETPAGLLTLEASGLSEEPICPEGCQEGCQDCWPSE